MFKKKVARRCHVSIPNVLQIRFDMENKFSDLKFETINVNKIVKHYPATGSPTATLL
jgi:hypothetical protein